MNNCVFGSGMCGYHLVKLVREVTMKKMSTIDKEGAVKWVQREVTCLKCPKANQTKPLAHTTLSTDFTMSESPEYKGAANKKQRISESIEMSQSAEIESQPIVINNTQLDVG